MIDPNKIAREFHEAYERLSPSFGYATRADTKQFDPDTPNGRLMIAVCEEVGNKIDKESFQAGFKAGTREGGRANGL